MEVLKNLITRFRQSGILLFIGILLIVYVAFGFVYWQQSAEQGDLEEQINNIWAIVNKPLADKEKLIAEYDQVNLSLTPILDSEAIAIIVGIAESSGIDVSPGSDNLVIPSAGLREEKVGGSQYQIYSFKNVSAQGSYENVTAFISDLDSGGTHETLVLKRVTINRIDTEAGGELGIDIDIRVVMDIDLYTKS